MVGDTGVCQRYCRLLNVNQSTGRLTYQSPTRNLRGSDHGLVLHPPFCPPNNFPDSCLVWSCGREGAVPEFLRVLVTLWWRGFVRVVFRVLSLQPRLLNGRLHKPVLVAAMLLRPLPASWCQAFTKRNQVYPFSSCVSRRPAETRTTSTLSGLHLRMINGAGVGSAPLMLYPKWVN